MPTDATRDAPGGSNSGPQIVVHPTWIQMERLFALPLGERRSVLAAMYGSESGELLGPAAMMIGAHEGGDAFQVGVDDPRYPEGVARLRAADAWRQVEIDLRRAWEHVRERAPEAGHPDTIDVWLVLGNPADRLFLERTLGYYGMGSMPGVLWLVAWPTDYNESRIGACAVHELAHQIRSSNLPWRPTVSEWVVSEGLAEVLALDVCGPGSTGGWYAAVTGEVLDAAWAKVIPALDLEGLAIASAYVMGDEIARKMGRDGVGLPHMAGYAVGRRIVERYLAASGHSVVSALLRPTPEIVEGAGIGRPG